MKKQTIALIAVVAAVFAISLWRDTATDVPDAVTPTVSATADARYVPEPIAYADRRVTKKPFGIYITPQDSPVSPERFSGYHTGVDFETFDDEQDIDVPVYAICSGPLLERNIASGYGGVVVQSCTIDGQQVTVVYGHLQLSSVSAVVGQQVVAGKKLGMLGTGYSTETDGERKHLHLGIHIGTDINIRGYVSTEDGLAAWLNIVDYLR